MKKVRYIGRASNGVTVDIGGTAVHVPHGETIDVEDDVAESLLNQDGQWQGAGGRTAEPEDTDNTPTTED